MAGADAGVVGQVELNSPTGTGKILTGKTPAFWAWVWFGLAVFIVCGFHVRILGQSFPPPITTP